MTTENKNDDFEDTFDAFAAGETPEETIEVNEDVQDGSDVDEAISNDENIGDEAAQQNDNILDGLNEAQLAHVSGLTEKVTDLEHRNSSSNGRIGSFQRKVNDLEATLEGIRNEAPENAEGDKPTNQELNEALSGDGADWNEFKEEYPEVADAIDRRFAVEREAMNGKLGEVKAQLQPLQDSAVQTQATKDRDLLMLPIENGGYGHEDFLAAINSPEFSEWLPQQPEPIQQLVNSADPADAAYMIDSFKLKTGYGQTSNNADLPSSENAVSAQRLAQSRKQKLVDSQSVSGKGSASTAIPDDDFESAFNVYAQ